MQRFLTADLHFDHSNIIKFCDRPFLDVEEMNEKLISNYNSVVRPQDEAWILGDFGMLSSENAKKIFSKLNGKKNLILGNHDRDSRGNVLKHLRHLPWDRPPSDYAEIKQNGHRIILTHYAGLTWSASHHGALQAFGHSHGQLNPLPGSIDVGVDNQNYYPISVDEFIKQAINSLENYEDVMDKAIEQLLERKRRWSQRRLEALD